MSNRDVLRRFGALALPLVVACGAQSGESDGADEVAAAGTAGKCVDVSEGANATLSCANGQVIRSIDFASYGNASGSCDGGLTVGTCQASTSKSKVSSACVGRQSCVVSATNGAFGDPCGGVAKHLSVKYTCGSTGGGVPPGQVMPVFLLAGQSNMVGNVDPTLFQTLLDELVHGSSSGLQTRLVGELRNWYLNTNDGYASYGYSDAMATFESSELIRLHAAGFVDARLTSPYSKVWCSMNDAKVAPLTTNCGSPFGLELVLGHVLGTTAYSPASLIKVAQGGTTLYTDWRSPRSGGTVGPLYVQLRSRIQSLKSNPASINPACTTQSCRWSAFIWFQGENDSFDKPNAQAYEQNLKNLIADVRGETGASTLPVIIVKIGKWAQSMAFGSTVAAAQQSVVKADPNARIVSTDDLSGFYHFDPAAQMIIGERVARSLQTILR
jgi:Carbohydrate esterase, sialic acid-specific acetylesterase/Galactose binding lectin domain